jgi:Na+-translocating ferredoxin:NAD+ oxidoreductase subunit D
MENTLHVVSASPHIRSKDSVQGVMRDVMIALIPATLAGIYYFGMKAIVLIVLSVLSCMAAEALWQKMTKQKITIRDYSAAVTGLLIAFNIPVSAPVWLPVIGGFFAIIIVKQFFGGLGQNFMNPALAARAFLLASWPVQMTSWTVDGVSAATPLGMLKEGTIENLPGLFSVFVGNVGGCIGETSALALLLGGAYLLYKRVITWEIPVTFIATVFVLTWIFGRNGFMTGNPGYEILAGGLMLGAFFMATDYSSSPMTAKGKIIMGVGCGFFTSIIRVFGGYPEGVSYAILLMNLFVPLIDRFTIPKPFGEVK